MMICRPTWPERKQDQIPVNVLYRNFLAGLWEKILNSDTDQCLHGILLKFF